MSQDSDPPKPSTEDAPILLPEPKATRPEARQDPPPLPPEAQVAGTEPVVQAPRAEGHPDPAEEMQQSWLDAKDSHAASQRSGTNSGWEGIFEPGEVELWQGQPEPYFGRRDLRPEGGFAAALPLIVGLVWAATVIAIVKEFYVKLIMLPFSLPFIWSGYNAVFVKPKRDAEELAQTWYTLSNRALYIASVGQKGRKLERFPLDRLDMEPRLVDGDPGEIIFGSRDTGMTVHISAGASHRRIRRAEQIRVPVGFRRLRNAREVYGMVLRARAELLNGREPQH